MSEPADIGLFRRRAYDWLAGPIADCGRASQPGGSAIVCLTRGYDDVARYGALVDRNRSIYDRINRYRTDPYPLIIFHEGNVLEEHQRHILACDLNPDVRFVDVSSLFCASAFVEQATFREGWTLGYRLMCRFHALHIWLCCRHLEYILRLDEDCILDAVDREPMDWLREKNLDFVAGIFTAEAHDLTNRSLPPFVAAYRAAVGEDNGPPPYDQRFPYTNFYATRIDFWRQRCVQRFLCAAAGEPDFLRLRWGDLPILGLALKMYGARVTEMPGIVYRHFSHNMIVGLPGR
jgi:hypothetical protein